MHYADYRCNIVSTGFEYVVTGNDVLTGKPVTVHIPSDALFAYRNGAPIQSALHMLTVDEREFLISGIYDSFPDDIEE